jgi:hypothetical protein
VPSQLHSENEELVGLNQKKLEKKLSWQRNASWQWNLKNFQRGWVF